MSRVIVKRRPDGIVQIHRRSAWRALAGPVPAAVLGFLLLSLAALAGLAAALIQFPMLVLLVGGLAVLMLSATRFAWRDRDAVRQEHASRPRPPPPLDAA
jgi:predicted lipid-binding transport protein (Tim44 family)